MAADARKMRSKMRIRAGKSGGFSVPLRRAKSP
jgi:hypothetical protein